MEKERVTDKAFAPLTVIKVGGAVVEDEAQLTRLINDFAAIPGRKVLVHGGGRRATKVAAALGIESKMVDGRRITDADMLEVVTMVYGGLVNKNIVARLQAQGVNALGLTGADIDGIRSHKRPLKNGIDFLGFHTYLTQTGKVVRKVRAKSIDNMKRKIRKFRGLVDSGKMTLDSVVQSYASWTGHISHGNTYHLRQNMDAYFFSYFPELKPSPKGDTTHGPKTEQPCKQVEGQVRQPVRQPDRLDRGR